MVAGRSRSVLRKAEEVVAGPSDTRGPPPNSAVASPTVVNKAPDRAVAAAKARRSLDRRAFAEASASGFASGLRVAGLTDTHRASRKLVSRRRSSSITLFAFSQIVRKARLDRMIGK